MGKDKALLVYHRTTAKQPPCGVANTSGPDCSSNRDDNPQVEHVYDLLIPFCSKVFVSTRPDQGKEPAYARLPQLHDLPQFNDIGPLGGILSAMTVYPDAAWLVLACDLPYIIPETIQALINGRDPWKFATAFISTTDQLPEPLCAIWEPQARIAALKLLGEGIKCPRKILIRSDIQLLLQKDPHWLDNVNDPQEYAQAKNLVRKVEIA